MSPEKVQRVIEILQSHGIDLAIGGCGCCDSPWVSFAYHGEVIVDDESATFSTVAGHDPTETPKEFAGVLAARDAGEVTP